MKPTTCSITARFALAFLLVTAAATQASADILYDNLSQASGGVATAAEITGSGPLADSFSTGNSATSLTDVKLLLDAANPGDGIIFGVGLLSDNSISPGSVLDILGFFSDSSLTTSLGVLDIPLATPYDLAADTRYWILVVGEDGSSVQWSFDAANGGTGVAAEYNYYAGNVYANNSFTPYQMEVSSTPEPASWSLLAAVGVWLALERRRRCHARA